MKRIYLAAAAVLTLGMTANAVGPKSLNGNPAVKEAANLSTQAINSVNVKGHDMSKVSASKDVMKKAPEASDLYGAYEIRAYKPFDGDDFKEYVYGSIVIGPGSTEGYVELDGLCFSSPVECPVITMTDKNNNTYVGFRMTNGQELGKFNYTGDDGKTYYNVLTMSTEELLFDDEGKNNGSMVVEYMDFILEPGTVKVQQQWNTPQDTWPEFSHVIMPINVNQMCLAKLSASNNPAAHIGYYNPYPNMGLDLEFIPMGQHLSSGTGDFVYNASEWEDAGNATISKCGFLDGTWNGTIPAFTCPVKVKKGQPSQAILVNPFKNSPDVSAVEFFTFDEGYIYLDLSDPDFAIVRPITYSGLDTGVDLYGKLYFSNQGGVFTAIEGMDMESAKLMFDTMGYEYPSIDDNNVLTLPNVMLSSTGDIALYSTWSDGQGGAADMTSIIELPAKVQASVKGIEVDEVDVNAPTRYFNLQGVEISAPAKGEVVIVKKGGKAVKTVF